MKIERNGNGPITLTLDSFHDVYYLTMILGRAQQPSADAVAEFGTQLHDRVAPIAKSWDKQLGEVAAQP